MKAILISDHAIWCALMMNGKKTIEVRKGTALYKATKKLIDENGYAEFYVYCTKKEDIARIGRLGGDEFICERYPLTEVQFKSMNSGYSAKGKVIFKFRCYKVEEIYGSNMISFEKDSCVDRVSMFKYLNPLVIWDNKLENLLQASEGRKMGYAIHISDLEIFDKAKELSEFSKIEVFDKCDVCPFENHEQDCCVSWKCRITHRLTKAPQSYVFIESEEK